MGCGEEHLFDPRQVLAAVSTRTLGPSARHLSSAAYSQFSKVPATVKSIPPTNSEAAVEAFVKQMVAGCDLNVVGPAGLMQAARPRTGRHLSVDAFKRASAK